MKDLIISKASKPNASLHVNLNDLISQKIDKLLQGQNTTKTTNALGLKNHFNIPSNHYEEVLLTLPIPVKVKEIHKNKGLAAKNLLNTFSHNKSKAEAESIPTLLAGLADLIVSKLPDISLDEQLDKLDSLWELKKDSHNDDVEKQIHQLEIALANALFANKNKEPGGSPGRILELENKIAGLMSLMIPID